MTTGELVFYSGIGLLALTVILAVLFAVKKPQYHPENAAMLSGDGQTAPLRNGYPTDRLTVRRDRTGTAGPTERIAAEKTAPAAQETLPLSGETALLSEGTAPLSEETALLTEETVPCSGKTIPLVEKTVLLTNPERSGAEKAEVTK